ncbi:MAG: DUF4124 domain-containing protein [Myxococcota bacterium]
MLHVTVLIAALLGQTIYTWTDAQGEEHFTDDPSTIPKGVKAKTMAPGEVETVRSSPEPAAPTAPAAPDAGSSVLTDSSTRKAPAVPPENKCTRAKKAVAEAEAEVAAARKASAAPPTRDCQSVLNTQGHAAYAQCMASRKNGEDSGRGLATVERRLNEAKEDLRRAQAAGCQ